MNKILVPVDFSQSSEFASKMASTIAKKSKNKEVKQWVKTKQHKQIQKMLAGETPANQQDALALTQKIERLLELTRNLIK